MKRFKRKAIKRHINWNSYTNFASRNSKDDLVKLCNSYSQSELIEIFETRDEAGLSPIHWAAINNRPDIVEYMIDSGVRMRIKCKNKLFADGTSLHLAAINGAIEVASVLLARGNVARNLPNSDDSENVKISETEDWLNERDSEGQTPLMRSAPPKTKRLNIVKDLLRKNLWSLSGRPAEMALLLIANGADWRQTDTINNMNLMHLAITNDYEDIVNLLLVIDKQLLEVVAKIDNDSSNRQPKLQAYKADIDSDTGRSSSNNSDSSSSLITSRTRSKELISNGLMPLQLAIVYGRVSIISLLWWAEANQNDLNQTKNDQDSLETQKRVAWRRNASKTQLKRILWRSCWTNRSELAKILRVGFLKLILALDFILLGIYWMPLHLDFHFMTLQTVTFMISYLVSMSLAFRVMLRNPGYLRQSSVQYLSELKRLIGDVKISDQNQDGSLAESGRFIGNKTSEVLQEDESKKVIASSKKAVISIEPRWKHKLNIEDRVRILCHKCRCVRRPRSRHCNYCNHCVQDFDHHCIYLGCCIGRNNRLDFMLTMISLTILGFFGSMICIQFRGLHPKYLHIISLIWVIKYALIGGLTSFLMLRRASLGVTMYEAVRSNRIEKVLGSKDLAKFDKTLSIFRGPFWRHPPNRFFNGDLPIRKILYNLREFSNFTTLDEYLVSIVCPDSALSRSISSGDERFNLYKFI